MNIVNWAPFGDMDGFFDRYFNQMGRLPNTGSDTEGSRQFEWRPSVDISETNKQYLIKATLPEVDKDDVEVSVENGVLTISGERRYEIEDKDETRHRVESMYGRFSRSFTLPSDADESAIAARSKNGVLKVSIPKVAEVEQRKGIQIDVE